MLLRRFSFPPADDATVEPLFPLTSYWFIEPRRMENQRERRENGSDEAIEGDELAEGGLAAEPGLMPRDGDAEVATEGCAGEDVVLDITGA